MKTTSMTAALILTVFGAGLTLPAVAQAGEVMVRIGEPGREGRVRHQGNHKRHGRRDHHSYDHVIASRSYPAWGQGWGRWRHHVDRLPIHYQTKRVNGKIYYYDDGVFYRKSRGRYNIVPPPVGAVISWLPRGYKTVHDRGERYYYVNGTYYRKARSGYEVTLYRDRRDPDCHY